jgi:hypothetical protein
MRNLIWLFLFWGFSIDTLAAAVDVINWQGVSAIRMGKYLVPAEKMRGFSDSGEGDSAEQIGREITTYIEEERTPELPFLSFFLNEAFMALHEMPVAWQRYLYENSTGSDFLKRVLLVSKALPDDADKEEMRNLIARLHSSGMSGEGFHDNLLEILSIPFVWNNLEMGRVLRSVYSGIDEAKIAEHLAKNSIRREMCSVIFLNLGFLAKSMRDERKSKHYFGLLKDVPLAVLQTGFLSEVDFESQLKTYSPNVAGYVCFQEAVRMRYGVEGRPRNLLKAHQYYQEFMKGMHYHPGIFLDIVSFYGDLLSVGKDLPVILAELSLDVNNLQSLFFEACWRGFLLEHVPLILEGVAYLEKNPGFIPGGVADHDLIEFFNKPYKSRLHESYELLFSLTAEKRFELKIKTLESAGGES